MQFSEFDLDERLHRGAADMGFVEPTPIQADAIPPALEGRDVLGAAMTGSGKTAAYVLPILNQLLGMERGTTRGLVLTPTRELAQQVEEHLAALAAHTDLTSVVIHGGVAYEPQERAFRNGVDVVIATPGRLLDHMRRPYASLDQVEFLVLDEADRMLDMGFIPDIRRVMRQLPARRQTLLFSATMPGPIVSLSRELLTDPATINIERKAMPATGITQVVYPVRHDRKPALFLHLLEHAGIDNALGFVRTRERADRVAAYLKSHGVSVASIHGDRSQIQRTRALEAFKTGKYRVLVATDVAARGLDLVDLTHVVNIDVPAQPEDYIHRVGRTARYEATGDAITFVAARELADLHLIEKVIGSKLPRKFAEGFEYSPTSGAVSKRQVTHASPRATDRVAALIEESKETEESTPSRSRSRSRRKEVEESMDAADASAAEDVKRGRESAEEPGDEPVEKQQAAAGPDSKPGTEQEEAGEARSSRSRRGRSGGRSRSRRSTAGEAAPEKVAAEKAAAKSAAETDADEPAEEKRTRGRSRGGRRPTSGQQAAAKRSSGKPSQGGKGAGRGGAAGVRPWWESPTRETEGEIDEDRGAVSVTEAISAAGEDDDFDLTDSDFEGFDLTPFSVDEDGEAPSRGGRGRRGKRTASGDADRQKKPAGRQPARGRSSAGRSSRRRGGAPASQADGVVARFVELRQSRSADRLSAGRAPWPEDFEVAEESGGTRPLREAKPQEAPPRRARSQPQRDDGGAKTKDSAKTNGDPSDPVARFSALREKRTRDRLVGAVPLELLEESAPESRGGGRGGRSRGRGRSRSRGRS